MSVNNKLLEKPSGATKKRKRLGRGIGTGHGKTCGKGHKGQNARKGGGVRPGFEGGQTPLYRRLPKRGFKNSYFKEEYNEINVYFLDKFDNNSKIDAEILKNKGFVISKNKGLKILGKGELTKKLEVYANKFSKSAVEKIEKAGGKAIVINEKDNQKKESKSKDK